MNNILNVYEKIYAKTISIIMPLMRHSYHQK